MALSDTEIRRSRPGDKPYKLADSGGLYLMVTPSGGKLWRWKFRFEGTEKLMAFGRYPEISLAEVRELHAQARKLLSTGVDPMAERKAEQEAREEARQRDSGEKSFQTIAELWMGHWGADKCECHLSRTRRRLEKDIFPEIGARPISEVESPEILALVKKIEARGAADVARRSLQTIGQIFRYAVANGHAKQNPAVNFKPADILKPRKTVNMARVEVKELPGLLRAIEVYQGKAITRLAMKLLALTFVRTSELIGAQWEEFDFDARRWNIPAMRMKMKTAHIVPLSVQAIEILELLRPLAGGSPLVFPGDQNPRKSMSNMAILMALKRMGYKGQMTGHGFRGLASTILHEQGYPHEHIEMQLAHAPRNAVSAAYNHAQYLEPRTKMMQDWADFLERTQRGGKVLPFRQNVA